MDKELINNIRKIIIEKELDAVLISDIYRILYLLGIPSSFNLIEIGFFLLITREDIYLIGDPFSFSLIKVPKGVKKEVEGIKSLMENGMSPVNRLKGLVKKLKIKKIGSFEDTKLPGFKVVKIDDPFLKLFLFPDENRLAILKENAKICEKVLKDSLKDIKEGCSEIVIRNTIDENIYHFGGERRAFPTKVIFGGNTANPFAISNNNELKEGEPLFINFGIIRSGIGMEIAKTYIMGKSTEELRLAYKNTSGIYKKFLEFLSPGKITGEVYNYVWGLIKKKGYDENFIHPMSTPLPPIRTGIIISPANSSILKPGAILSLKLDFYFPGKFGINFQDVVLLGEKTINLTDFLNKGNPNVITDKI